MHDQLQQYINLLREYNIVQNNSLIENTVSFSFDNDNSVIKNSNPAFYFKGKNDTMRMISLMDYVHNELFTTGEIVEPEILNTAGIMFVRKTGSLFCWCYSIMMAEMLLSLNRKALLVSCLPKTFDHDSHAAILTYLDDIGKWGFFDPTFNTYFVSQYKEPLDIFEIRAAYESLSLPRFCPITIKKDWVLVLNGITYETYDEWYCTYIAKNTFRFIIPTHNYYGAYEKTNMSKSRICISPVNYHYRNEYDEVYENITYA